MMRKKKITGLFTFDGPVYKDRNGEYCDTYITNEILQRFYVVCDKLIVLIRCFEIEDTYQEKHLTRLELSPKLEIIEMPNINSPFNYITKGKYKKIIAEVVGRCDMFFLRIPSVISDMVATICRKKGFPYCVEVGGCSFDSYWNHDIVGRCIAPVMFFNQRKTVRNASYASYVTTQWLQHRYPTKAKISVCASNVYLNDFNEELVKEKSAQWGKKRDVYTLGTIANYEVRYKGQHKVIEAISKLKAKGLIFRYELVGGGNPSWLRGIAEKFDVADQIVFHGIKRKDEVRSWLSNSIDIYIQPSKQEGLPRSVIEAMNQGCVCLGSRKAGIPELLEADELFKADSIQEIQECILRIIESPDTEARCLRNFEKSKKFALSHLVDVRSQLFLAYKNGLGL